MGCKYDIIAGFFTFAFSLNEMAMFCKVIEAIGASGRPLAKKLFELCPFLAKFKTKVPFFEITANFVPIRFEDRKRCHWFGRSNRPRSESEAFSWKTEEMDGVVITNIRHYFFEERFVFRIFAIFHNFADEIAQNAAEILVTGIRQEASGIG